jgi:hypothetical protein
LGHSLFHGITTGDGVYGHSSLERLRTDKAQRQEAMEDSQ